MLTPGPQGLGWIPPVGSEACAHQGASELHSGEGEGQEAAQLKLDPWRMPVTPPSAY